MVGKPDDGVVSLTTIIVGLIEEADLEAYDCDALESRRRR
jgi:hypothetical protein